MSQPVAGEYGLIPMRPTVDTTIPLESKDLVSQEDIYKGTEFGGVAGLIQPPPHVPDASERLHMVYAIDPLDDGSRPDSVVPPELEF